MKEFTDKVAVITGAASGMGRAVAERCVREGMKVVLADVEETALMQTVKDFRAIGADALLPVVTNVSKGEQVDALAQKTLAEYGAVHFLFNNAGVAVGGPLWENTVADWEWVLGVNLWGVIHGIRAFVPHMLKQDSEGHIVNTASVSGLIALPGLGAYTATKYGVVGISETLHQDFLRAGAKLKVSVLCPGPVNTRIAYSERNRPEELPSTANLSPEDEERREMLRQFLAAGMSPAEVADKVFEAVKEEKFYILTHPEFKALAQMRVQYIVDDGVPDPLSVL